MAVKGRRAFLAGSVGDQHQRTTEVFLDEPGHLCTMQTRTVVGPNHKRATFSAGNSGNGGNAYWAAGPVWRLPVLAGKTRSCFIPLLQSAHRWSGRRWLYKFSGDGGSRWGTAEMANVSLRTGRSNWRHRSI